MCKSFEPLKKNFPSFLFKSDSSKFGCGGVNENSGEAISVLSEQKYFWDAK